MRLILKLDDEQTKAVAFFVVVGSFAASGLFAYLAFRAQVISSYPTASGVVTRCETESVFGTTHISISYRYSVDGETYNGFKSSSSDDRTEIDEAAARYSPGAAVNVYYNPEDPADAYLQDEKQDDVASGGVTSYISGFLFIISPLLFLGAAYALALIWQHIEDRRQSQSMSYDQD